MTSPFVGGGSTTPIYPMHSGPEGRYGHCVHSWAPNGDGGGPVGDRGGPGKGLSSMRYPLEYYAPASPSEEKDMFDDPLGPYLMDPPPSGPVRSRHMSVARRSLIRSLHIPSKRSTISSGFEMPLCLLDYGVTDIRWKNFQKQIKKHASLSLSQWLTCIVSGWGYGTLFSSATGFFGPVVWVVITHKLRKQREQHNWIASLACGAINQCLDRWNKDYFEPLGLHVAVEPPGCGNMADSDVTSTKLFKYQQKHGVLCQAPPGSARKYAGKKELRYQYKEGRGRTQAARRGRIIVLPLDWVPPWARGTVQHRKREDWEIWNTSGNAPLSPGFFPTG